MVVSGEFVLGPFSLLLSPILLGFERWEVVWIWRDRSVEFTDCEDDVFESFVVPFDLVVEKVSQFLQMSPGVHSTPLSEKIPGPGWTHPNSSSVVIRERSVPDSS